mgnify:CR=1 FL=1
MGVVADEREQIYMDSEGVRRGRLKVQECGSLWSHMGVVADDIEQMYMDSDG